MSKPPVGGQRAGTVFWDDDLPPDSWWVMKTGQWIEASGPLTQNAAKPERYDLTVGDAVHVWVEKDGLWGLYDGKGVRLRSAFAVPTPAPAVEEPEPEPEPELEPDYYDEQDLD